MADLHSFRIDDWTRLEAEGVPIWFNGDKPDWFVPNDAGDRMLSGSHETGDIEAVLKRIDTPPAPSYQSRTEQLEMTQLKECWIHITNRCNMECRHCMFTSSPRDSSELSPEACREVIQEARALGCRLFYFTGGEPFVSNAFFPSLEEIFEYPDTHVVALTNLSLISKSKERLRALPTDPGCASHSSGPMSVEPLRSVPA